MSSGMSAHVSPKLSNAKNGDKQAISNHGMVAAR